MQGEGREWKKDTHCGSGLGSWDTLVTARLSSTGLLVSVILSHCMFSPVSGLVVARVVASRSCQAHVGCPWIQIATHTRVSQCGVCWCSPYQGFPSTVRAHSRGMAFCSFRGAIHEHRQRTNTYACTPTALVSFHCIARSLPDTLLWAAVVCRHFVALILSVSWLGRCCGRPFPATWHKQLQVQV